MGFDREADLIGAWFVLLINGIIVAILLYFMAFRWLPRLFRKFSKWIMAVKKFWLSFGLFWRLDGIIGLSAYFAMLIL